MNAVSLPEQFTIPVHTGSEPVHPETEHVLVILAVSTGLYPVVHVYVILSLLSYESLSGDLLALAMSTAGHVIAVKIKH